MRKEEYGVSVPLQVCPAVHCRQRRHRLHNGAEQGVNSGLGRTRARSGTKRSPMTRTSREAMIVSLAKTLPQ